MPIFTRLTGDHERVAQDALSILINISADALPSVVEEMKKRSIPDRLMEIISTPDCTIREKALMLLANFTANESGAKSFLQAEVGENGDPSPLMGLNLRKLLHWFLVARPPPEGEEDSWAYAANVVRNTSQCQEGRDVLRKKSNNLLPSLLTQVSSENVIRRRGIIGALRNLAFEEDDHWWLINEVKMLPPLLYLLMGPDDTLSQEDRKGMDPSVYRDGESKQIEDDKEVKVLVLETLLLFCSTRSSRQQLRNHKVYPVVRELDLTETDEEIQELIYKLVNFLQRDETEGKDINSLESGNNEEPVPLEDLQKEKNDLDLLD